MYIWAGKDNWNRVFRSRYLLLQINPAISTYIRRRVKGMVWHDNKLPQNRIRSDTYVHDLIETILFLWSIPSRFYRPWERWNKPPKSGMPINRRSPTDTTNNGDRGDNRESW